MPKLTFYNLSDEKKNTIVTTTIDEFYRYGYEKASISRIVKNADIAKGSFYQYFENKEDLFKFIIYTSSEKKLVYLKEYIEKAYEIQYFELLENLCLASLRFISDNKKLSVISDRFIRSENNELKEKVLGENAKKSNYFMEQLLKNSIEKGEIKKETDIEFVAGYITNLFFYMSDYIRHKNKDITQIKENEYKKIVKKTIDILKNGIKN